MWQTQMLVQSTSRFSSQPSRACPLQVLLMGCSQDGRVKYIAEKFRVMSRITRSQYCFKYIFIAGWWRVFPLCLPPASCTKMRSLKFHDTSHDWRKQLIHIPDSDTSGAIFEKSLWENASAQCVSWEHHVQMLVTVVHYFGLQFFKETNYIILYYI